MVKSQGVLQSYTAATKKKKSQGGRGQNGSVKTSGRGGKRGDNIKKILFPGPRSTEPQGRGGSQFEG